MLTKSLYAFCLTLVGCLLLLTGTVHSDVTVLKEIAEAETEYKLCRSASKNIRFTDA